MKEFMLQVTTPEGIFWEKKAEMAEIPVSGGKMGVYGGHEPAAALLVPGELMIYEQGRKKAVSIGPGFAEILPDKIRILTGSARWTEKHPEEQGNEDEDPGAQKEDGDGFSV